MAKRKALSPEKQKYAPVICALKKGLLDYLKALGQKLGLQRTRLIDRIVAGIIREKWPFNTYLNEVYRNPTPEQRALLEVLQSGEPRCAYLSLHKSTAPEFYKAQRQRQWPKSRLMERMLTSYLLAPEEERVELMEPPKAGRILAAQTYEETPGPPASPASRPQAAIRPLQGKKNEKKEADVKFLLGVETGLSRYLLDFAMKSGTTRNRLVEYIIGEVCAGGLIFSGDISILTDAQKKLYYELANGGHEYNYLMIRKSVIQEFEKYQKLTAWKPLVLLKRMLLTWLLAPWPDIKDRMKKADKPKEHVKKFMQP